MHLPKPDRDRGILLQFVPWSIQSYPNHLGVSEHQAHQVEAASNLAALKF